MDIQVRKIAQNHTVYLQHPITAISSCKQFVAVSCMDDTIKIWNNNFATNLNEPTLQIKQAFSGISGICFKHSSTHLAAVSIDSVLRTWEMPGLKMSSCFDIPIMTGWKVEFCGENLVTCGQLGKVIFYDRFSQGYVKKTEAGDAFLTAIAISRKQQRIVVGNANGDVYVLKNQDKTAPVNISTSKPHFKKIRTVKFSNEGNHILSGSDDTCIARVDIQTSTKTDSFEGHLQRVTCLVNSPTQDHIFYSCSYDRTIKIWDVRSKNSIHSHKSSGGLQAIQIAGKFMLAGGASGHLQILQLQ